MSPQRHVLQHSVSSPWSQPCGVEWSNREVERGNHKPFVQFLLVYFVFWFAPAAFAHETWIIPSKFFAKPDEDVRFDMSSGMEFPKLEAAIRPARIDNAKWRLGKDVGEITEFREGESSLSTTRAFPAEGVATVWLELKPNDIELSDDTVSEYFEEINATENIRKIWQRRIGRVAWKETYTKHAKTIVKVGDSPDDGSWETPVGMKLELRPVDSPFEAKPGQKYTVQLLHDGQPLPDCPIGLIVSDHKERMFETSDADGKAAFSVLHSGETMFFAVHLRHDAERESWQSDFTTLTIRVR